MSGRDRKMPPELSEGPVEFYGKVRRLTREHQELLDPYLGGQLLASEIWASLPSGAFRSGLILRQGDRFWVIYAKRRKRWQGKRRMTPPWDETAWELALLKRPPTERLISRRILE